MDGIKRFLIALSIAGCGGGGGGGGMPTDAGDAMPGHDADIDAGPAPANDRCLNATTISIASPHAEISATTAGANPDLAAPCGTAGTPDVFFKFTLNRRELVYADTFGATGNTALYFASSCVAARTASTTPGDAVCSTGACSTSQSQVVALLDAGTHYLVLAGQGAATIHFQHAEVGTGTVTHLAAGSSTTTGTTGSNDGQLYACDAGGPENAYWWHSCPSAAGGAFVASTCDNTAFDTMMSFQMPGADTVLCDDDSCSVYAAIGTTIPAGAGLYVLAVDGFSSAKLGNYSLSVTRP
ncbi:MAG TPA: hypothetical protein VIX73_22150 [Kofleriaceae bacterium]